eukprot:Pgem_evm2s12679
MTSNLITIKKRLGIYSTIKNKNKSKESEPKKPINKELEEALKGLKYTYEYIQKIENQNKNLNESLENIKKLIKN